MEKIEGRLYRCEYCHNPVIDEDIQLGGCICGSRRIKIATSVTSEEVDKLKERGYGFEGERWMDESTAEQERRVEREV